VTRTIRVQHITQRRGGLGRHVRHDSRSLAYRFVPRTVELRSVRHHRNIPVLDQGQLGSCTGNAALGCLGTDPYYAAVAGMTLDWDEAEAVAIYSAATQIDEWFGTWPPDDTGSDGLSVAKVCVGLGWIAGYRHAFGLEAALAALCETPVITGVNWYTSMFDPDGTGQVQIFPSARVEGGHEFVVDELDMQSMRVWCTNSWGTGWGVDGHFWMSFATWRRLLDEDGDVTVFVPATAPPPAPVPVDPDDMFAAVLRPWVTKRHCGGNAVVARAAKQWLSVQ
jgi:hypothetical protein